ncbi:MAG: SulP family inorganic anion transporter [Acidimicrobiaceae bacterium]|nr:SulP family inorganic anion transporter [Acidimicrobiaceae bacterium]MXW89325.1 SulP family inorganic anion transporter [Acidimicrobiaceae bacterium]MYA14774.1 SulP family inorganic anion transporter [Acidimicrobiaceae bacterium]MYE65370.1 SulP family inorganic anion transporter [Acidimicrobiaceae bacterium]MYI15913.1 SulP family inorganic anion transporter [Acidimicrobiaceae bacterium]
MSLQVSDKLQGLRGDVFGGLTAAVVALPLSLAFGVASGLGAIEGLYSAVVVGMLAALLGGSRTQISGPTAPLSVAMAVVFVDYADGDLAKALAIVVMAGIIQVLLGALRLGSFVAYTPYAVVSGFTSAVGVIIIVVQVLPFFGTEVALGGALKSLRSWPDAVANIDSSALALGLVTLAVCIFWPGQLKRFLPPSVAALIIGTLVGVLWLTNAPTIGEVPTGLPDIHTPELVLGDLGSALAAAVTLALLGSINSLLTARVADSLTRESHDPNRELMGVGVANVLVAFVGGVPGAGATSCTVANVRAGGRSRVSGVLCATILAALVLGLGRYVGSIPHAVLAGILIKIGFDIIDWRYLSHIHRVPRENVVVLALTLGLSIISDLVIAVAVGLVVAALTGARQVERLELDKVISTPLLDMTFLADPEADDGDDDDPFAGLSLDLDDDDDNDPFAARCGLLSLRGSFTAASSTRLFKVINHDMAEHEVVIFDFTDTVHIDDSAALAIGQLADTARDADTQCIVMGMSGMTGTSLHALNVLREIPEGHFVESLDEARVIAKRLLD